MDLYAMIVADHQKVKDLFSELESARRTRRAEIFEALKEELNTHKEAEERTFYAALGNFEDVEDLVDEALSEHVDLEEMIEELDALDSESDEFMELVVELREALEHHVEEEEGALFAKAKELLDDDQAKQIATAMDQEKRGISP